MADITDLFTYPSNPNENYVNPTYYAALVNAADIVSGTEYKIATAGTTDFTTVGAINNNVGTIFIATGTPSGTGTAYIVATGMLGKFEKIEDELIIDFAKGSYTGVGKTSHCANVGKYINYFEEKLAETTTDRKVAVYDFANLPLFNFNTKTSYNLGIDSIITTLDVNGDPIWQIGTDSAQSHVIDGDKIELSSSSPVGATTYYVDQINTSTFNLYTDSGRTTPADSMRKADSSNNFYFVKDGSGVRCIQPANASDFFGAYTAARYRFINSDSPSSVFSSAGTYSGTINQHDTDLYISNESAMTTNNPSYSVNFSQVYTDSGATTHATLTEEYYAVITRTFTSGSGGGTHYDITSDWTISDANPDSLTLSGGTISTMSALRTEMQRQMDNHGTAFARINYIVDSGTVSDNGLNAEAVSTSIDYDEFWFLHYDSSTQRIYGAKKYLGGVAANDYNGDITVDASSQIRVQISLINPAEMDSTGTSGTYLLERQFATESGSSAYFAKYLSNINTLNKWTITGGTMIHHGNERYRYQDSSNVTQNGAIFGDKYYKEYPAVGDTLTSNETPNASLLTLDGSGYLTGVDFTGCGVDTITGGVWDDNADVHIAIKSRPDEYVARTLTTAETEEVFDTQDGWVTDGFSATKQWYQGRPPSRAKITYIQPSTVNITQSGRKFVRNSEIVRWQLEVEYDALSADEFYKMHAIAQATRGQGTVFTFDILYGATDILWNDMSVYTGEISPVIALDTDAPSAILTLGGFSNDVTALKQGEIFITGGSDNGDIVTVVHDAVANAYGEVQFRITHPTRTNLTAGETVYKRPAHLKVSLSEDNFEWSTDANNKYYVSVKFDCDNPRI